MENKENKNSVEQILLEEEKEIVREEKKILDEIKKEENVLKKVVKNVWVSAGVISILIVGAAAGFAYWQVSGNRIYTDKAEISAPRVDLTPETAGVLESVFVNEGDVVQPNTVVAQVGNELIKTKVGGIIVSVNKSIGKLFNRGEAVVSMIDPGELRVVGRISEDKGLSDVRVGQFAKFSVDAFGSKKYEGIVESVSQISRNEDIVFNISDKRETKEFEVKVRFDTKAYPELKDGMSAKLWIYK